MKILIFGNGGHAVVVADILALVDGVEAVGVACNLKEGDPKVCAGLRVLDESAMSKVSYDTLIVALGDNMQRRDVFQRYEAIVATAVHPSAIIAPSAIIEPGCSICAGVVVNPGARIRANTILNTGCTVDHHCDVGPHAHVAPGVHLAGNVNVNEGVFMGIGSCAVQGVSIGAWSTVGAGGAVIADVPPGVTVMGVPAQQK